MMRIQTALAAVLLLFWAAGNMPVLSQPVLTHPLERPENPPPFHVPRSGERLDDGWWFAQELIDASPSRPDLFNAVPVGMDFSWNGRGFLATLHTVFWTTDGGSTWENLDHYPPPQWSSRFNFMRSPAYLSDLRIRRGVTTGIPNDSVYYTLYNTQTDAGRVHVLRWATTQYIPPVDTSYVFLVTEHWLTGLLIPNSMNAFAFEGLDGVVYHNDQLSSAYGWDTVQTDLGMTWASAFSEADSLLIGVGSHHWVSSDGGETWEVRPSADPLTDAAVSFFNRQKGIVGGGREDPVPLGWVRKTDDGGQTWSERMIQTDVPIRAVLMVTEDIFVAAGGLLESAEGKVWMSEDRGETWDLVLETDAEMLELAAGRVSGYYVDVAAAGVFPDFRGGVWKTRLAVPASSGAVLRAMPDTLDFGIVAAGEPYTRMTTLRNFGDAVIYLEDVTSGDAGFEPQVDFQTYQLDPDASYELDVIFSGDTAGVYEDILRVENNLGHLVEIYCRAEVSLGTDGRPGLMPERTSLRVWPNPGNARFRVQFELPKREEAVLNIYDINGRHAETLLSSVLPAGEHVISWNAASRASGIYFLRLEAGGQVRTNKVLLIK